MNLKETIPSIELDQIVIDQQSVVEENQYVKVLNLSYSNNLVENVKAYLVLPRNSIFRPYPAIHFIHWLEPEALDSNRSQFLNYAKILVEKGYISILPDCFWSVDKDKYQQDPQYYRSKWWKTNYQEDVELCKRQIMELMLTQEILLKQEHLNTRRIGLAGHDFGAMFGCLLPTLGYKFKSYLLMAATGRFSDWFRFGSTLNEDELGAYKSQMSFIDPQSNIHKLGNANKFFLFADDDFYVPKAKSLEFFDLATEPKEIKWYDAKHSMNTDAFSDLTEWILKTV